MCSLFRVYGNVLCNLKDSEWYVLKVWLIYMPGSPYFLHTILSSVITDKEMTFIVLSVSLTATIFPFLCDNTENFLVCTSCDQNTL